MVKVFLPKLSIKNDDVKYIRNLLVWSYEILYPGKENIIITQTHLSYLHSVIDKIDPDHVFSSLLKEIFNYDLSFLRYIRLSLALYEESVSYSFNNPHTLHGEIYLNNTTGAELDWNLFEQVLKLVNIKYDVSYDQNDNIQYILYLNQTPEITTCELNPLVTYYYDEYLKHDNTDLEILDINNEAHMIHKLVLVSYNNEWFNAFLNNKYKPEPIKLHYSSTDVKHCIEVIYLGASEWANRHKEDDLDYETLLEMSDYIGMFDWFIVITQLLLLKDNTTDLLDPYKSSYRKSPSNRFNSMISYHYEEPEDYYQKIIESRLRPIIEPNIRPFIDLLDMNVSDYENYYKLRGVGRFPGKFTLEGETYYIIVYFVIYINEEESKLNFNTFLPNGKYIDNEFFKYYTVPNDEYIIYGDTFYREKTMIKSYDLEVSKYFQDVELDKISSSEYPVIAISNVKTLKDKLVEKKKYKEDLSSDSDSDSGHDSDSGYKSN